MYGLLIARVYACACVYVFVSYFSTVYTYVDIVSIYVNSSRFIMSFCILYLV